MMNHKEAAQYLGITPGHLYNKIHKEEGPRREKNHRGRWDYKQSDLDAWKRAKTELKAAFSK